MKLFFCAALLLINLPLFAIQEIDPNTDGVLQLTKDFWTYLNLGDLEKLAALGRPEDSSVIPSANGTEAAGMMKMKDLPQLVGTRKEIVDAVAKAFTFSQPVFSADRKSAEVTITPVSSEARSLREIKMIYDVFMGQAYEAQRAGNPLPTLESVRTQVMAPNSPAQQRIDEKTAGLQKMKLPPIVIEKIDHGWRINFQKFFGKKM